ncbi:TPA: hypothetical protein DEB00_00190 [Candidatus Uhrbacteria bacterium]|nr:hypothetical protein [Candidatus Uhrbacteria bacterium]
MIKHVFPVALLFLLLGAGCTSSQAPASTAVYEVPTLETILEMDLPNDSVVTNVTDVAGHYTVIGYTDQTWQEVRDSFHTQLMAQGFQDTVSAKNSVIANPDKDVIIGSYIKANPGGTGPNSIVTRSITIGIEDGKTKFSVLKQ